MAGIGTETLDSLNTLVFSSLEFLFRYLPLFLLILFLIPKKMRCLWLLAYSLLLYWAGEPGYVFLLLGMAVVNFLFGLSLEVRKSASLEAPEETAKGQPFWEQRTEVRPVGEWQELFLRDPEEDSPRRKILFILAVSCNLLLLAWFKLNNAFDKSFLLPVGLSFYIFKNLSYLSDVYRGTIPAEHSPVRFGAYLCMFPQIVSGPIMRYSDALKGFCFEHRFSLYRLESGVKRIAAGLAAKVLIADRLGILWNDLQTIGFESISTPLAWLGAAGYSLQLYFDFWGYSMIAVGIGEMIGLPVIRNFHHPYAARSVSEFYRRWHMTLGNFFRDYVYIPLGGNRKGMVRTVCNLLFVWLLTGLWHGNSVNFLLWGLLLGLLVAAERLALRPFLENHRLLSHLYVLVVLPLTWMVFAIPSLSEMGIYFLRLFPLAGRPAAVNPGDFLKELKIFAPTLLAAAVFCVPAVGRWCERHKNNTAVIIALFFLFWLSVYQMANAVNNPFMYANF